VISIRTSIAYIGWFFKVKAFFLHIIGAVFVTLITKAAPLVFTAICWRIAQLGECAVLAQFAVVKRPSIGSLFHKADMRTNLLGYGSTITV